MKVTEIEFGMLETRPGGYSNVKVAMRAKLDEKDSVDNALFALKALVGTEMTRLLSQPFDAKIGEEIAAKRKELEALQVRVREIYRLLEVEEKT